MVASIDLQIGPEAKALPREQASALVFTRIHSSLQQAQQTQLPQEHGTSGTCQMCPEHTVACALPI